MKSTAAVSVQTSVIDEVKKTLLSLDPQSRLVLFGSRARAETDNTIVPDDSDWDFLLLTSQEVKGNTERWIRDFLHDLELKTDAIISTIIYSQAQWPAYRHTPLYKNILKEGIPIAMSYNKNDVIQYRIDRAKETLEEAKLMAAHQHWNATVNRLYYACFYIVHALLLSNDHNVHTHSGAKSAFHKNFVKSGQVSPVLSRFYDLLFNKRQSGDYGDLQSFDKEEIAPWLPKAEKFIAAIESLISKQ